VSKSRVVLIAILALCGVVGTVHLWTLARSTAGMDFYQMWVGARAAREFENFYSPVTKSEMGAEYLRRAQVEERSIRRLVVAHHRRELETVGTPLLYTTFAPLRGTYERGLFIFQILILASFVVWMTLLLRTYGYSLPAALAFFAAVVLIFGAVKSDVRVGNINQGILLLIAFSVHLLSRRHYAYAGVILSLATLIKPYTMLVVPLLVAICLLQRRWSDARRLTLGSLTAALVGIAFSSIYFEDAAIWLQWFREFQAMPEGIVRIEMGNFAFVRIVRELSGGFDVSLPAMLVLSGAAIAIAKRCTSPDRSDFLAVGLGCVIFQFASPIVWLHHLLLSLPLVAYLMRPATAGECLRNVRRRQITAGTAFLILSVEPWDAMLPTALQVAATVNVGIAMLYGAALFDLSRKTIGENGRGRQKLTAVIKV